ncbi:unnamed protein product [Darwinula stevensoni]|uniref:S-adenosylmethionine decarboxylase n=1 Tax=Darwinula stevensoni TaxID=69355 RepID=A0A7R9A4N0_9CRUS|nr:unnamed protein product [Darwinula stevensoni]CAG0892876.1 unnamed protein product [Darwinula stevensoni]
MWIDWTDGAAYCLGQMNRDCWYLYTLSHPFGEGDEWRGVNEPDQTLEVLMMDLDTDAMQIFTRQASSDARQATQKSGIHKILPGVQIDDFLFDPCGYSMNGILANGSYMTIHVTPEPHCSYVSFESNIPMASYRDVLVRVLACFRPAKFIMTVFANKGSVALSSHKELDGATHIGAYQRKDLHSCQFHKYHLTYAHYVKFPS